MKYGFTIFLAALHLITCGCSEDIKHETINGLHITYNPERGIIGPKISESVNFINEISIGQEEGPVTEMFSSISHVIIDDALNIYIYDDRLAQLFAFSEDGKFKWVAGQKGQGPGDFERVKGIATDGVQYIYIANLSGTRIDRFSMKGKYVSTLDLSQTGMKNFSLHGYLNPNILVLSMNEWGECGVHIFLVSLEARLTLVKKIIIQENIGVKVPKGVAYGPEISVEDSNVIVALTNKYEFRYYDSNGNITRKILRNFSGLKRAGLWESNGSRSMTNMSLLCPPMRLSNNFQVNHVHWPTNVDNPDDFVMKDMFTPTPDIEFKNSLDFYNNNGEFLGSLISNGKYSDLGQIIHTDKEGKLYSILDEPYSQVKRYMIEFNH